MSNFIELTDRVTGITHKVPAAEVSDALAARDENGEPIYHAPDAGTSVPIYDERTGAHADVAFEDLEAAQQRKGRGATFEEGMERENLARIEREHGGIGGALKTGAENLASGMTLGASDAVMRAAFGDEYAEDRRERAQVHDVIAPVADIAGAVVPSLVSGGALSFTPAGLAAKAGRSIGKRAGTVVGMAAEGGMFGIGEGIKKTAISEEPVSFEGLASNVGSGFLYGAGVGGGIGIAGKAVTKAIGSAKRAIGRSREAAAKAGAVSDDLAKLDSKGLRAAKEAELERIAKAKQAEAVSIADGTVTYRKLIDEVDPMVIASGSTKRDLARAKNAIKHQLSNPKGLSKKPSKILDPLQREERALQELIEQSDELTSKLAREDELLLARIDKLESPILKGKDAQKYGDWAGKGIKSTAAKEGVEVTTEELAKFREALASGEAQGLRAKSAGRLGEALEANQAMQARIEALFEKASSPKLSAIADAADVLKDAGPASNSIVADAVRKFVPGGGHLMNALGSKFSKAAGAAAQRTTAAVDAFLDVGRKVGRGANPAAVKVLSNTAFGPEQDRTDRAMSKKTGRARKPKTLLDAYKARESEVLSQVQMGPDGPIMRAGARERVAGRLDGVRAVDPKLADMLETHAARRITFLAAKLPKRPDVTPIQTGPDRWRPSDMAMRQWARYVTAVEDPGGVEERVADATVTPEDAEAMREVYPERFHDFKMQIIARLPELRKTLPYAKRLSLSIYTGVPVDPALEPRILNVLQSQHTFEPGTDGGTHAPTPSPQFGSVSKPEGTPAQERAQ